MQGFRFIQYLELGLVAVSLLLVAFLVFKRGILVKSELSKMKYTSLFAFATALIAAVSLISAIIKPDPRRDALTGSLAMAQEYAQKNIHGTI